MHSCRIGSQATFVGTLVEVAVTVVADGALYTSGKKIKQEFRVVRPVELIAHDIVMFQMSRIAVMPCGLVEIRDFLRLIDDQGEELGQGAIQIVQPVLSTSPLAGAGERNRAGTGKGLYQAGHLARQMIENPWRQATLASLVLEWLRNVHLSSNGSFFYSAQTDECIREVAITPRSCPSSPGSPFTSCTGCVKDRIRSSRNFKHLDLCAGRVSTPPVAAVLQAGSSGPDHRGQAESPHGEAGLHRPVRSQLTAVVVRYGRVATTVPMRWFAVSCCLRCYPRRRRQPCRRSCEPLRRSATRLGRGEGAGVRPVP